jgi:hypothetical protein
MLQRTLPAGFIAPCLPTKTDKLPSGGLWLHEIKHDGFRVIARKEGPRVRLYSRPGNDLTRRFPLIVDALARLRSRSCIIDGEARILKFRPAGQSRRVSFSHWQLNPRLSRAFFAAPLRHGVAFAVYIVITLQNAVQTSPMHRDRMGTRRRRDLQRRRPAVLLSSRPFCHKKHPD